MNVVRVDESDLLRTEKCQHCGRKVRPGQVVIAKLGFNSTYLNRDFVVHARCMRLLLDSAPAEQDQIAYEELRERILVSGTAFPPEEK